jgi:hypothetical protein
MEDNFNDNWEKARTEARELLSNTGYYEVENSFYVTDYRIAEAAFEKLLWDYAKMYVEDQISADVFDYICGVFEGSPAQHTLNPDAQDIMYEGVELIYYRDVNPDAEEFHRINNYLKNLVEERGV